MNKERDKMKTIIKECIIYEDSIIISLEDTRDNYIDKNALGKIGYICISPYGIIINAVAPRNSSFVKFSIFTLRTYFSPIIPYSLVIIFKTFNINANLHLSNLFTTKR
mgnify:CR=1 FL=1